MTKFSIFSQLKTQKHAINLHNYEDQAINHVVVVSKQACLELRFLDT